MKPDTTGGIVLAAGASQRMGRPKALLPYGATTFVRHVVDILHGAGVGPLIVVTRQELQDEITAEVGKLAQVIVNPSPDRGMSSSIRCGVDALAAGKDALAGILLALVDQPQVRHDTVLHLLDEFRAHSDHIVIPRSPSGRRGHPVIFPIDLMDALRQFHDEGAREVVWQHVNRVLEVPVDDGGPFTNVNTPQDLSALHEGDSTPFPGETTDDGPEST